MELVSEFDISQLKVNHFPPWDGISGQKTALQTTMVLITVHYTSFKCIIIYYLKIVSHKWHGNTYTWVQPVIHPGALDTSRYHPSSGYPAWTSSTLWRHKHHYKPKNVRRLLTITNWCTWGSYIQTDRYTSKPTCPPNCSIYCRLLRYPFPRDRYPLAPGTLRFLFKKPPFHAYRKNKKSQNIWICIIWKDILFKAHSAYHHCHPLQRSAPVDALVSSDGFTVVFVASPYLTQDDTLVTRR